jgi:ribosome-associated toxin RatA of RatAB toxin-antitoxin module
LHCNTNPKRERGKTLRYDVLVAIVMTKSHAEHQQTVRPDPADHFSRSSRRSEMGILQTMNFVQSIVIAASPEELFSLSQDYQRRLEWDPFLKSAELMGGATEAGVGVRAWCVAHSGLGMETEYVSFHPPRTCAVKMTRGPRLIRSFAGSWRFEKLSDTETRVSFRYNLQAQPRWLAWLLGPIMRWIFARDTRKRLAALKRAVESGKVLSSPRHLDGAR